MSDYTDLILFLNAFLYLGTACWIWWHKRPNLLGTYLSGMYALSALASFAFFKTSRLAAIYDDVSVWMLLYLYLAWFLVCQPFIRYPDGFCRGWQPMRSDLWEFVLSVLIAVFALLSLVNLPNLWSRISVISQFDSMEAVYVAYRNGDAMLRSISYFERLSSIFISTFSKIVLFGLFYFLTCPGKRLLAILTALCCLFPLGESIATAGRMGSVTFMLDMLFLLILFRGLIPPKTWKVIRLAGLLLGVLITLYVARVTIDRFEHRSSKGSGEYVLNYAGQPMLNFAHFVPKAEMHSLGDNTLPLARNLMGFNKIKTRDEFREKWQNEIGIPLNVFYTFIGDFCIDYSEIPTLILALLVFFLWTSRHRYQEKAVPIHQFFALFILFQCVGQGVFYFTMKTVGGNLRLAILLGFYLWMRLKLPLVKSNEV